MNLYTGSLTQRTRQWRVRRACPAPISRPQRVRRIHAEPQSCQRQAPWAYPAPMSREWQAFAKSMPCRAVPSRDCGTGLPPPFSFSLCAVTQNLIASQRNIKKPTQMIENKQQRPKLIASFSAVLAPTKTKTPAPRLTHHRLTAFLFNTNKPHKITVPKRTLLKTKEKQFPIQYKFALRCARPPATDGLPAAAGDVACALRFRGGATVTTPRRPTHVFHFSNRQFLKLEHASSHSKQNTGVHSNRQEMHSCVFPSGAPRLRAYNPRDLRRNHNFQLQSWGQNPRRRTP